MAALKSVQAQLPDLILLDIHMPEMDGYEACRQLKSDSRTRHIPVLFVSAMNEEFNKLKAFEAGAVDYITKPLMIEEARARINVHLELQRRLQENEASHKEVAVLKKEVNSLAEELGRSIPYPEVRDITG